MKKQYIRPEMAVIAIGTCAILAASGEPTTSTPYGGSDGNTGEDWEYAE